MVQTEGAPAHGTVAHLLPQTYKRLVAEWLEEDTPSFDYGGFVVGEEMGEARLLGKSEVSICDGEVWREGVLLKEMSAVSCRVWRMEVSMRLC